MLHSFLDMCAEMWRVGDDVDVLELVRSRMPGLSASGQQVAEAVLAAPERVVEMSASRLAEESHSSVGTVVRFCHSVGFPGYQDFKLQLAAYRSQRKHSFRTIAEGDSLADVVDKVFANIVVSMVRSAESVRSDMVEHVANALRSARHVLIVASGTSLPLANEFGTRLSWAGLAASYPIDSQTQEMIAGRLSPDDLCFAISHSGTTAATLRPLQVAAAGGANTAALTSFADSPIGTFCEHIIVAGAQTDRHRSADMSSRMVHHAVLQVLWSVVHHANVRL
jgi:DNA-binding MurR/RpiR family transcriptional regulator